MKQSTSGWVILTRKLVAGFHPQNDSRPNSSRGKAHRDIPLWACGLWSGDCPTSPWYVNIKNWPVSRRS